ncbi:MAG TPA: GvpL/GvpF family gas vesicle protein [Pyrinomonadaceae bacterium]|nr:GvpL/GvpF family gas vesicle protein [Pyrinomonadaceae bacterium]
MAKSKTNANDERRGGGGSALYVYCVGARDELTTLFGGELPDAMEGARAVELVEREDLAAVACAVPLADYGEGALEAKLSDAAWTATRAVRHERAVEHFSRRATVVPLRFGTIYLSRENVARMLEERRAQLRATLARLKGREEWGLNVYVERARLREQVASLSERLREMEEAAAASPPGRAYLLRKKVDALRDEEARAETRRAAGVIEQELASACDGSARLRVHKDETGELGDTAARLAFLVRREGFDDFRAAAERLAERYTPLGFRFELTGPWPAYNFAAANEEKNDG